MPVALGEVFLYYFGFNIFAIAFLIFQIMRVAEPPWGWKTWNVSILSISTAMTIYLVIGLLVSETAGTITIIAFLLPTMIRPKLSERLFVKKGLREPAIYLLVLFVISFAAVYWKTNLPVLAIPLGIIHLAYAGLVYYAHKTWEGEGMWRV